MTPFEEMKWTAFALGELEPAEMSAMEPALSSSEEARRLVDEARSTARLVSDELASEESVGLDAIHYAAIEMMLRRDRPRRLPDRRDVIRGRIGFALSLAASIAIVCAAIGAVLYALSRQPGSVAQTVAETRPSHSDVIVELTRPPTNEPGLAGVDFSGGIDPFVRVADRPVSRFPLAADSSDYDDVRRAVYDDRLPAPESVKVEQLVNAFDYNDPPPVGAAALAGRIEVGPCPWSAGHRLARIGIKAKAGAGLVAEDVKVQVAFDPKSAESYRLIGYEQDRPRGDASPGENVEAGHGVTALYEIRPAPAAPSQASPLRVSVQYRDAGKAGPVRNVQFPEPATPEPSPDFNFAAAVAEFGLILKQSPVVKDANFEQVLRLANTGRGADPDNRRQQFIELVRKARELNG